MTFADQTINQFLENVAASAVTPSGGAVAAVGGAFGAALCEMVCIHTIEKDGYADVRPELTDIRDELGTRRVRLLELADEDSMAVDELQAAFETPNDEDRAELVQEKSRRTAEVPLEIAETCLGVLEHARVVTAKGNRNAIADAGTGAFLAHSALKASVFTVQSNLELIEDPTAVADIEARLAEIDRRDDEALKQVEANIEEIA
ncbi:cyclodeaminase/cyclohydrolase family protein [Halococcus saccharolyticus]|uniref:Formimidoyltetrahydrofolate cyclodeaminase n=1 Tax=Halococcus saccharolyticus DSM 5350 TaxID=1227455 RepID=M0MK51_9EURY|nr:cyclodeaminase/cyclohydrolase family protein [Halococcus saccharolyticus]EMA46057.1 formimidoyltetrahydrofolate cyclodeaminase [Halococcus saccharolyticus DSM 5350]